MPAESFANLSISIATQFLQTVVLVDDKAFPSDVFETAKPAKIEGITTPGRRKTASDETSSSEKPNDSSLQIDGKKLIRDFASLGLVCTILQPEKDNADVTATTVKVSSRADLIVLDWIILDDDGECAKDIISAVIKADQNSQRLRLICIYTSSLDLEVISEAVQANLTQQGFNCELSDSESIDINLGATKIVFLTKNIDKLDENKLVSLENLPLRLITEFTKQTMGVVSNTALVALSAVRSNTHEILHRLHPKIDAPFLSHRSALSDPDDASELLVELVTSEIRAFIDRQNIAEYTASLDAIEKSLAQRLEISKTPFAMKWGSGTPSETIDLPVEDLKKILEIGIDSWVSNHPTQKVKDKKKDFKRSLTHIFSQSDENPSPLEREFAMLTSLVRWYQKSHFSKDSKLPPLTLGTIIKRKIELAEDINYFLCIMPSCDCLRLVESRSFPFIPLSVIPQNYTDQKNFSLVVLDQNESFSSPIYLQHQTNVYMQRLIEFFPSANCKIMPLNQEGEVIFKDKNNVEYQWIGEVKHTVVQKIVNEFISKLFRIGFDESEWLRKSSKAT